MSTRVHMQDTQELIVPGQVRSRGWGSARLGVLFRKGAAGWSVQLIDGNEIIGHLLDTSHNGPGNSVHRQPGVSE